VRKIIISSSVNNSEDFSKEEYRHANRRTKIFNLNFRTKKKSNKRPETQKILNQQRDKIASHYNHLTCSDSSFVPIISLASCQHFLHNISHKYVQKNAVKLRIILSHDRDKIP
jgi:hypothetical protein